MSVGRPTSANEPGSVQPSPSDEWLEAADLSAVHGTLLDTLDQSVILTDLHGRIRAWNAGATRIFGYQAAEMLGRTPAELYPDGSPERLEEDLQRILEGEDHVGEWRGRRRDGSTVWVEVRTRLVRDRSGRPIGFLGVARDVSERRRSEAALAYGQARLELIANTAPAFIVQCDAERRFTFVNRAYAARFGLEPEQVVGKYVWEVVGEQAYAGFKHHVDQVLAGRPVEFEMEIPYELIGRHYIQGAYAPQLGPDGSVQGLVAVLTDVSERKRAEAALRESDTRLKLAQSAAGLAIWEWDPATGETSYTPEFNALYGLPADGRALSFEEWRDRLLHPEDRERVMGEIGAALRDTRPYEAEYRVVTPDGDVRWIASRGQVVSDPSERKTRMVGVHFDVTRRRDVELQLQQLERVETVARLAGGVAHEANNQMAVVLGAATFILRRPDLPEAVRQDATYIQEAAERTAAITQQLLAFSRRQVVQPRVLDLNATIRAFETILRRSVAAEVDLRLDLAPTLGQVRIDEGQLQQVLLNLTLNARDAMPNGGTLVLETREIQLPSPETTRHGIDVRPGAYVQMVVRDTGTGMDMATRAHIFEPFFTTKGVGRGTGLGLASVYGIVKQSDGYVFADSSPGRGTSMTVLLPVATDPLTPTPAAPASEPLGGRGTVLVVDDEPVVRSMMARALREAGYRVLDAESGAAALELAASRAGRIDILISDLAMPKMSGRELADRLAEQYPAILVLFVSGYPGEEVERRGLLESGRPFLQKPFAPESLIERVRQLLDAGGGTVLNR